jgi:L-fuconolactonase
MSEPVLDSHVHVWDPDRRKLPWLPEGHPLRRVFRLQDLASPHDGGSLPPETLLVQADADPAETVDLLDLAAAAPSVLGVVGWVDLTAPDVADRIAAATEYADQVGARLVGIRCPPANQVDPDALTAPPLILGIRAAAEAGLAVDLLLRPAALPGAARLATALPQARLVLDHLGNPQRPGDEWLAGMRLLSAAPNVTVKLSGFAALAGDEDRLGSVVDTALRLFGSERLMFGSDWPVCTLHLSHGETVRRATDLIPAAAQKDVFGATARRSYQLAPSTAPPS